MEKQKAADYAKQMLLKHGDSSEIKLAIIVKLAGAIAKDFQNANADSIVIRTCNSDYSQLLYAADKGRKFDTSTFYQMLDALCEFKG